MACDKEIWNNGFAIADMSTVPSKDMEAFREKLDSLGNPAVAFDWHYQAGAAILLFLGDYDRAKALVLEHGPAFHASLGDKYFRRLTVFEPNSRSMGQIMHRGRA